MTDDDRRDGQVLVVDDDEELRQAIIEILENEGLSVATAASADQALKQLADNDFHLVLLDMVMPGIDGLTAIPLIRKLAPRTRIIVITAYSSVENAVQALHQGADDYLTKPFKIDSLLALVGKSLQESRFTECDEQLDADGIFQGLANQLRRKIIIVLQQHDRMRFMELVRALGVEDHTKVNFHLKVLRESGFIEQGGEKEYFLSPAGRQAADCLQLINKGMRSSD